MINPSIYKHYKGNLYEVIGIAKHRDTMADTVVYKPLYESVSPPPPPFFGFDQQICGKKSWSIMERKSKDLLRLRINGQKI